jgi:hypothetical protein
MKLSYAKIVTPLVALAIALGVGACSRSQHITGSVTGPTRDGAGHEANSGCPTLIANDPNSSFDLITEMGACAQFRPGRMRLEVIGDATEVQLLAMGDCIAADVPTINITSAHANVFLHGTNHSTTTTGNRLTFGPVLPVGVNVEPGIVLASDADGNVFEIIWPKLAGLGTGSPIIRVQLARWNQAIVNPASKVDVSFDFVAEQNGVKTHFKGHCEGLGVDGTPVLTGNGSAIPPCPTTLAGSSGATANETADIVQFRPGKRLRMEVTGDVAAGILNAMGSCATADAPTIHITGGTGSVFKAGSGHHLTNTGQDLAFGALLPLGAVEPGIVIATDQFGNVLEIIWPQLAGLPPGLPIFRLELATWDNWVQTGRQVDVSMTFNVVGPDGSTATFEVRGNHMDVPVAR